MRKDGSAMGLLEFSMHSVNPHLELMVGVVTLPAGYTALAPRMILDMGQAVYSVLLWAHTQWWLPTFGLSALLRLLFPFIFPGWSPWKRNPSLESTRPPPSMWHFRILSG